MRMHRILLIHGSASGLGDRIRIQQIIRFLKNSGFTVYEAVLPSLTFGYIKKEGISNILASIFPLHKFPIYNFKNPILQNFNFTLALNFLKRIKRELEFDVIIAETSIIGWLALKVFGKNSAPLLVDVHGLAGAEARGYGERFWFVKEALEAEVFHGCTHLWVVSKRMREYIIQHFKISAGKITVIYNGAEPRKIKPNFADPLRVIYAGNFAYWERVDDFLDLAKIASSGAFRFYLAGAGLMKKRILYRIRSENIKVRYLGYIPRSRILGFMSKMQIGIAPSSKDLTRQVAFPIKVLDYMSCGLPVIAPRVGDWGEMIETKGCGIALKDDSVQNYLKALELLKRKDVWQDKSIKATRAIKNEYDWKRVLLPLKGLIKQLCDNHNSLSLI